MEIFQKPFSGLSKESNEAFRFEAHLNTICLVCSLLAIHTLLLHSSNLVYPTGITGDSIAHVNLKAIYSTSLRNKMIRSSRGSTECRVKAIIASKQGCFGATRNQNLLSRMCQENSGQEKCPKIELKRREFLQQTRECQTRHAC